MLRKLFIIGNVALVLLILVAIVRDAVRPWMPYQKTYHEGWLLRLLGLAGSFGRCFYLHQRQPGVIQKNLSGRRKSNASRPALQ